MSNLIIKVILYSTVALAPSVWAQQENHAADAFQTLQTLVGEWQGRDQQGNEVKSTFKLMVSNTVVMEALDAAGMEEMLTLYSIDGDGISLLHYCPTNNQPHMRAVPTSGIIKQLRFSFRDAGNLPDINIGHEHAMLLEFEDKDHVVESWTWRRNGKDTQVIYHLARGKEGGSIRR